ncbi:MAG: DnaJ domain-containing protein [Burkholderiaceae bacterium]|nr:DnaJ domain-containing protein [Burkholderiaceae bacterium]
MEFKDYYRLLGVERGAPHAEIKRAYRKLVRQYHPDVSQAADAQVRMQEINEAWEVLQDPERRAAYDRLGQRWQGGGEFRPPPDWTAGFEFSGAPEGWGDGGAGHSDFFEALFGAARHRAGGRAHPAAEGGFAARGSDHHARIVVPLEDAFTGATRTLTLQAVEADAQGRPQLRERQLSVAIPKGLKAGQQIRLAGQGSPGFGGGAPGDLFLELQFEPHPRYRVDGRDLYVGLPVAPWEAALGATLPVATPGGPIEINVPAESQPGRKLRLRGRGIPAAAPSGTPGDLYLVLELVLPPANTEAARAAYRRMALDLAFDPRQGQG